MNEFDFELKPTSRVMYYLKNRQEYLLTNQEGKPEELTRVFAVNKKGKITMKGYLLGSILAHDPYILMEMEPVNSTYGELNPDYFK